MFKKKLLLPLTISAMAMLTACASSSTTTESAQTNNANTSNVSPFIDKSMHELYQQQAKEVYETKYFALGIPKDWNVVAFNDEELDTHISVAKQDHSATVTIRIIRSTTNNIEESCNLAKLRFDANGTDYNNPPGVNFGTCLIEGKQENKDVGLWLRDYDDDGSSYSISYTGSLETINEVLSLLSSNDKLGQLLVRPLAL